MFLTNSAYCLSGRCTVFAPLVIVIVVGCSNSDLPERAPVTGIVSLDGKPITQGKVTFVPDNGPAAIGMIDSTGRYVLATDRQGKGGDGAMVGHHRIRVIARSNMEPGAFSVSLIPDKYVEFAKSGLTAEVESGKENQIDLELFSK
ncbi:hypothetical protein [Bythopirellula polymerisocia]|nr:hypothetical protein [Bythopirellula polymerisocia]